VITGLCSYAHPEAVYKLNLGSWGTEKYGASCVFFNPILFAVSLSLSLSLSLYIYIYIYIYIKRIGVRIGFYGLGRGTY
jgi:hypothetical protein